MEDDNQNYKLIKACAKNNYDKAFKACNLGANHEFHDYRCFIESCKTGSVRIVKWLYSLGVNIHIYNNICFRYACSYGNLEIAKLLYSISTDTYHSKAIYWASKNLIN